MKTQFFITLIVAMLAASCTQDPGLQLTVSNPLPLQRNDASVLISRDAISQHMDLPAGQLPILLDVDGDPLPCQVDDLDTDGTWDELFVLIDLGPYESKNLTVTFIIADAYPDIKARTNVRLGSNVPGYPELTLAERLEGVSYHNYSGRTGAAFQMEGPAWETDLVGFRNYLDQRNGMDIFGKLTREMVLDSVGVAGRQSYHEPDEWGMDVLKVGTSLGAGAIGYMYEDSIYRVGDNGSGSYELLMEGSQRSLLNLSYESWMVDNAPIQVDHQIEVVGGMRCYNSSVTYNGTADHLDLVPGIVNMKSNELHVLNLNDLYTALITHDAQAEDTTLLAMALMVPSGLLKEHGETRNSGDGVTETYYARLAAAPGEPVPYRFYALWEKEDSRWASLDEVKTYLKVEADRWANPVEVELIFE